ncbi:hypothetical protein [Streptomyces luteolus]|uniref:DUF3558 domain-containing protein n=1 Tax=Streptomyces luteolus TaxID=3043615 RepID=A0ABT6SUK7_9ACTN|nr:hypothetical protein [Streptomyces sp. B-S-A12]MDI3419293.1 hypothetical protein [Streptomyces sp. B-S-A12]
MDLWDEDRQEWARPPDKDIPPPPSRARRALIAAAATLLLCGALVGGIWLWTDDDTGGDPPGMGGDSATPSASSACEAVDTAISAEWGLGSGTEENVENTAASLFSGCTWTMPGDVSGSLTQLSLFYGKRIPVEPTPTPTPVDGVPAAEVSGNEVACLIVWPTSFGQAAVRAIPSAEDLYENPCDLASEFAGSVAPNVPE